MLRLQAGVALIAAATPLLHAQDAATELAGPDAVSSQLAADEKDEPEIWTALRLAQECAICGACKKWIVLMLDSKNGGNTLRSMTIRLRLPALVPGIVLASFALLLSPASGEEPVGVLSGASIGPKPVASEKSADEIARELANPNNSLASLTFKNQFRFYEGTLPGAEDQFNYTFLFQPVFPFTLPETSSGGKANLFVRPGIPVLFDQPVFDTNTGEFDDVTGLGDIGFDIGYGVTEKNGVLWAMGMVGSLPTASDSSLASGQVRLGPEGILAKFEDWGVWGIFPSHLWDVTGWKGNSFSNTQIQPVLKFLPGGGWSYGSAPQMNYDWSSEQWSIPINLTVSRTIKPGKTPLKIEAEINYYVEQNDAFGSQWMIGFNITPVVPNFVESWIRK